MKNDRYVDNPFTNVAIRHDVAVPNENTLIWVDGPGSMLDWEWRDKHLRIYIIYIVNESYFFVFHVND